jgi:hypothetical protein
MKIFSRVSSYRSKKLWQVFISGISGIERALSNKTSSHAAMSTKRSDSEWAGAQELVWLRYMQGWLKKYYPSLRFW